MSQQILRANALAAWCWYMCCSGAQQDAVGMLDLFNKMFQDVILVWVKIHGSFCLGQQLESRHLGTPAEQCYFPSKVKSSEGF